jgi:transketolase
VIQRAAELVPSLVGGSADLESSTKTRIKSTDDVTPRDFAARNIAFGIREHAMGAILNGLALHGGYLPQGSTFLVFSDYMRPSIRLAALMGIPSIFVYTHDSLMLGEDGPTHQPVEHLSALRLIPNLHLFRPADGTEVAAAWTHALSRRDGPVAMALTRQSVPALQRPSGFDAADMLRGAYVIHDSGDAAATLLATGAEVHLAIEAAETMASRGRPLRVVSVPCLELFLAQDDAYRARVLGDGLPVLAVEMGRPELWCQLTGRLDHVVGVETFGASAPAKDLAEQFGFTPTALAENLEKVLGRA